MFDEQPDGDLHGECAAEIRRLTEANNLLLDAFEDKADAVSIALRKAWQLGQTYWQQADSDNMREYRKAEVTYATFQQLVDETRRVILAGCQYPQCLDNEDERCPRWLTGECGGPNRGKTNDTP
jgi:hypothetical protein